jgi:hypothetical protein
VSEDTRLGEGSFVSSRGLLLVRRRPRPRGQPPLGAFDVPAEAANTRGYGRLLSRSLFARQRVVGFAQRGHRVLVVVYLSILVDI